MNPSQGTWDRQVEAWARGRPDIQALVQIGSRVQAGAAPDKWSDYDYQLLTRRPELYRDGTFCRDLGPCWAQGSQMAFGNALKVTAVFDGALEVDFVILRSRDVRIALGALRWPSLAPLWPAPLRRGIEDLRIVAAPGWHVVKGGAAWERRYRRIEPFARRLSEPEFRNLCGGFWASAVWVAKKVGRGELVAAERSVHGELIEALMRVFQELAVIDGRRSHPLSRRAEQWLLEPQLQALAAGTEPDAVSLRRALGLLCPAFAQASAELARKAGWTSPDYSAASSWIDEAIR